MKNLLKQSYCRLLLVLNYGYILNNRDFLALYLKSFRTRFPKNTFNDLINIFESKIHRTKKFNVYRKSILYPLILTLAVIVLSYLNYELSNSYELFKYFIPFTIGLFKSSILILALWASAVYILMPTGYHYYSSMLEEVKKLKIRYNIPIFQVGNIRDSDATRLYSPTEYANILLKLRNLKLMPNDISRSQILTFFNETYNIMDDPNKLGRLFDKLHEKSNNPDPSDIKLIKKMGFSKKALEVALKTYDS